jgi:DNA-binding GntR family transcriptional regulator
LFGVADAAAERRAPRVTGAAAHDPQPRRAGFRIDGALEDVLAERYGIVVARTRHAVRATPVEPPQARLLGVPPLSPALLVERVSSDARGHRIAVSESLNRGDRCTLEWE